MSLLPKRHDPKINASLINVLDILFGKTSTLRYLARASGIRRKKIADFMKGEVTLSAFSLPERERLAHLLSERIDLLNAGKILLESELTNLDTPNPLRGAATASYHDRNKLITSL